MHQRIDCQRLVLHLLGAGYTTGRLGAEVGLSQPSISRLATGKTKAAAADVVVRLIQLAGGHVRLPDTDSAPAPATPQPTTTEAAHAG